MENHIRARAFQAARQALLASDERLLRRHALLSVGVGLKTVAGETTDEPCVKAFVARKLPLSEIAPDRRIPPTLAARPTAARTDVEEMRQPTAPPRRGSDAFESVAFGIGDRARHRPLSGGNSVSHPIAPLGTVATMVRDTFGARRFGILSCNHVIAALNRGRHGDPVLQPATGDGGRIPHDVCGYLQRYIPVRFGLTGANLVDAAVARVGPFTSVPWLDWVGSPAGVRSGNGLRPGDAVFKVGRTTGLTAGRVVAVHATGWIPYPPVLGAGLGAALFREQIITTGMAGFGDSGALLLDSAEHVIGLLFGGSPTHSFYNDIVYVQRELQLSIAFVM
jgi:hypothetical protein